MSAWGWLATTGGIGLLPWGGAKAGTLVGVLLVFLIRRWSISRQVLAVTAMVLLAIPVTDIATREMGTKDDGRIVLDETIGLPVATLGIRTAGNPLLMVTALVAFGVLDSAKPPPLDRVEAIPGGMGIVLDDVAAALGALLITALAQAVYRKRIAESSSPR